VADIDEPTCARCKESFCWNDGADRDDDVVLCNTCAQSMAVEAWLRRGQDATVACAWYERRKSLSEALHGSWWPDCLTWSDEQIGEVERWLADPSSPPFDATKFSRFSLPRISGPIEDLRSRSSDGPDPTAFDELARLRTEVQDLRGEMDAVRKYLVRIDDLARRAAPIVRHLAELQATEDP